MAERPHVRLLRGQSEQDAWAAPLLSEAATLLRFHEVPFVRRWCTMPSTVATPYATRDLNVVQCFIPHQPRPRPKAAF